MTLSTTGDVRWSSHRELLRLVIGPQTRSLYVWVRRPAVPRCGGRLRLLALIEHASTVERLVRVVDGELQPWIGGGSEQARDLHEQLGMWLLGR